MKALFFTLVSAFRFEPAVASERVLRRSFVVVRPFIQGEEKKGAQLPIYVSLADDE